MCLETASLNLLHDPGELGFIVPVCAFWSLCACLWLLINQENVLATWSVILRKADFPLPGFIGLFEGRPGERLVDEQRERHTLKTHLHPLCTGLTECYHVTLAREAIPLTFTFEIGPLG